MTRTTKGARMLRDALDAYGSDTYTLSEWNAIKQKAEREGKWRWKVSDTGATHMAVKSRVEKDATARDRLDETLLDVHAAMAAALHPLGRSEEPVTETNHLSSKCAWRERIGGKMFHCTNERPRDKTKQTRGTLCKWHARECLRRDHAIESSRAIEIPNDQGLCLTCYEATAVSDRGTLQKTPPRIPPTKVPGVWEVSLKREVQRDTLLRGKAHHKRDGLSPRATKESKCVWQKEHSESAFLWQCHNRVISHPTLHGAYLSCCGFHAPRCLHEYGSKGVHKCPPIDRRNAFGLCRHHLEAYLSTLSFEARTACVVADSEFDVPGIVECRRDRRSATPKRHPLAPKDPPPLPPPEDQCSHYVRVNSPPPSTTNRDRVFRQWSRVLLTIISSAVSLVLDHPNPVSVLLKDALWQLQFLRRGAVVALRIQRVFRGNRARRRVRLMKFEQAALRRMKACLVLQRIARGYLGRLAFAHEFHAVQQAVPTIQRIVRGGLARHTCRRLRASLCLQRNYRAYRQRCLAWALREEIQYMRTLQQQADRNYQEMLVQLNAFRRLRVRRVLRSHVIQWKRHKEAASREALERLQSLLSAVKIQRAFRRHQYYALVKRRYQSAQRVQSRVRGWLTRHLWKEDPGLRYVTSFTSPVSGFVYGKVVVLAQPSRSYAVPSRRVRMQCASLAIQRAYRGFMGRLRANMRWVAMLRRWEWLSMESSCESSDSLTLGHARYGFLLPSAKYHPDRRRHMLTIQRGIKADKGFAYKYQSVLELLQDRDGKRAWSLAREEQWKRDREKEMETSNKSPDRDGRRRRRRAPLEKELVGEKSIAMAQALFPLGSLVEVASTRRRDRQRFYRARVTAVHTDATQETNASTVDVEYLSSMVSVRGVRVYHETRVPVARLRSVGIGDDERAPRRRSVAALIENAIAQLKKEIHASRDARVQSRLTCSTLEEGAVALASVDALADRLRDEQPRADLLVDQRDFVNFVFTNSTLLSTTWLQVIDHVRYGTRDRELPQPEEGQGRASQPLLTPSQLAFYRAFGIDSREERYAPMPARASTIEERMARLGFRHEPSANVKDESVEKGRLAKHQRPHTTPLIDEETVQKTGKLHPHESSDELAALASKATDPSAQQLHARIYELKTLPRERHRESIIEVSDRDARSFVCGYPACGRCFSSHEAARLHQEGVHLHQRRLAVSTPFVDQYMHAYWPPTSPWNQELEKNRSFAASVGYYHCTKCPGSQGQFRTRRELQHHEREAHGTVVTRQSGPANLLLASPAAPPSTTTAPALSAVIWLGPYATCRSNLERRIEGFPATAVWHGSRVEECETHRLATTRIDPERCRACFVRTRRLALPCRIYRTVALPRRRHKQRPEQQEDGPADRQEEAYAIFSVDDPLVSCPVVREQDLIPLDQDDATYQKQRVRQYSRRQPTAKDNAAASVVLLLRLATLCRDGNGVDWAIGHVFRPCAYDKTYEVTLDKSRVVAVALEDIRAVGIVHLGTSDEFMRKPLRKPDDPGELKRLSEPRDRNKTNDSVHNLTVTLERYWRMDASDKDSERT